jgi:hypothetical protein
MGGAIFTRIMDNVETTTALDKASRKAGFTLADTVVSTFILAMGLGAAGLTFNSAMRMTAANKSRMSAMHLARYQIETLRTYSFADPALEEGTHLLDDIICGDLKAVLDSTLENLCGNSGTGGDDDSPLDQELGSGGFYVVKDITDRVKEVTMDVTYLNPMNNQMSRARLTTRLTKPLH